MSLAKKMQQGGSTPNLYDFYGKQYDYNDLAQAADQGLNEYLTTLKRSEKDSGSFRKAYSDLMSGIKDGSITFGDGQFHDSKGRYSNIDDRHKDYYGLMANYIYNKMGKSNVYEAPKDTSKIEWSEDSVKRALMRQLYNSDNENLQDFLNLDEEKNGVRGIKNRANYLANAFQSIVDNWDNTFSGYDGMNKTRYINLLTSASKALRDGKIDPGDYLALSKAVGGVDFRGMMTTGTPTVSTETFSTTTTETPTETPLKLKHVTLTDSSYDSKMLNTLSTTMAKVPSRSLVKMLRHSLYNKNYRFGSDPRIMKLFGTSTISSRAGVSAILNGLLAQGKLQPAGGNNPNLYYVPGLKTKRGTGWVWDRSSNQLAELNLENIPYAKTATFVPYHEKGGILKAANGAQLPWYNGIQDFTGQYSTTYGDKLQGINDKGVYGDPYGTAGRGQNNYRYQTDTRFQDYSDTGKTFAQNVENQKAYQDFTNELIESAKKYRDATDKSVFNNDNNVFLKWSSLVDKDLPQNSMSTFFDNGKLRSSWSVKNKDAYQRGPRKDITNIEDYIREIRNDQLLSLRHNDLTKQGNRYFYKDAQGNQHWVSEADAKSGKYKLSDKGVSSVDGNTTWTDYEITGLNDGTSNNGGSEINPNQGIQGNKLSEWWKKNGQDTLDKVAPLASEAGKLAMSLRTNKKMEDTWKKYNKPFLVNPYEYHTPVTGAFSEMQFRNQQAADTRRLANRASTSDASLNNATMLEGNKQSREYEQQGKLADDKEMQRTAEEARQHEQQNIQIRNQVANANAKSINDYNSALGNVVQQRHNADYQGKINFINDNITAPLKQRAADNKLLKKQAKQRNANYDLAPISNQQQYQTKQLEQYYSNEASKLQNEMAVEQNKYEKEHPDGDFTTTDTYKNYVSKFNDLKKSQLRDQYQMSDYFVNQMRTAYDNIDSNLRGNAYTKPFQSNTNNDYQQQNWYKILNGLSYKRGGKLSLSSKYLLNSIIK